MRRIRIRRQWSYNFQCYLWHLYMWDYTKQRYTLWRMSKNVQSLWNLVKKDK